MLQVNNLVKHFGDIKALDDLSFLAEDGQITGILGPNGAGKTTALRVLYGLLEAEEGTGLINGVDSQVSPQLARKEIGIFPDKFGLYERLTAREQISYFAGLHGLKGKEKEQALDDVIEKLDIDGALSQFSIGKSIAKNDTQNEIEEVKKDIEICQFSDWSDAQDQFESDLLKVLYPLYPTTRKLAERLKVSHNKIAMKLRKYGIG